MLFNSLHFIIFFPIIVAAYFLIPHKYRWILLLLASYYFYMSWKQEYVLLIIFSTLVNYYAAIKMDATNEKKRKRKYLFLSLASSLGLLFIFKYFNFFNDSVRILLNNFNIFYGSPVFKLLLPIGISFYTFQTLSYTIDIYRGKIKPERHLGIFALYVSFFPQLVAGPIERATNLLPQFFEKHKFDYNRVAEGLAIMLWGFFKKIVIADNVAGLVNIVYNNPENFTGVHFILATILFAFQIYCDFSGYSDIAIGTAKIMGFDLMKNFDRPYFAKSIADFWRRWHISLSSWFKDYLYIPLGGNRAGKLRIFQNLMITFIISGLWHGANWTFIIWGGIHGLYIVIGEITKKIRRTIINYSKINNLPRVYGLLQTSVIFLLVCFAWIFFRANTLHDAWHIIANLFTGIYSFIFNLTDINATKNVLGKFAISPLEFIRIWIFIFFLTIIYLYKGSKSVRQALTNKPTFVRWGFYYLLILAIMFFGNLGEQPFIYFQF